MAEYRIDLLDRKGTVQRTLQMDCATDDEAVFHVVLMIHPFAAQIRSGQRLVKWLGPGGRPHRLDGTSEQRREA